MFQLTISVESKSTNRATFQQALQASISRRLRECGTDIRSALKQETPHDTGLLRNKNDFAVDDKERTLIVFNRADYAGYVHEGRKPGKMPPIAALIPWARRHLVNSRIAKSLATRAFTGASPKGGLRKTASTDELKQAKQLAFLVARAIGRRGTKPQPWFANVLASHGFARIDRTASEIARDIGAPAIDSISNGITNAFKGFAI